MNPFMIRTNLSNHLINIPGWRTNRRIVVIESDDWGTIRMPSFSAYSYLLEKGYRVDTDPYLKYDSLASEEDLSRLFEVLSSVSDRNGNPAVITANTIVSNPDFERIRSSQFRQYFSEKFIQTLKRYPRHQNSFNLWKEGIERKLFYPQFHGMEHLNLSQWLTALRSGDSTTHQAFDLNMLSISSEPVENPVTYMKSMDFSTDREKSEIQKRLADGLDLFEEVFGFRSESFIATAYTWHSDHEYMLAEKGVRYLQGIPVQLQPSRSENNSSIKRIMHFTGQKNRNRQIYLVRNAHFEPSVHTHINYVDDCLRRINIAFRWGKPAIISAHRLNFIGHIIEENREKNLHEFHLLLTKMVRRWPELEFMTSNQLGNLITS